MAFHHNKICKSFWQEFCLDHSAAEYDVPDFLYNVVIFIVDFCSF